VIRSIDAIKALCDIDEDSGCWMWRGGVDSSGTPVARFHVDGKRSSVVSVRRVVLDLLGKQTKGRLATNKCDCKLCLAPKCAVAWTRKQLQKRTGATRDYSKDIVRKQAIAKSRRQRGTVLSEEKVKEMRDSGMTSREAAKTYGCSQYAAWAALSGKTWKEYQSPFSPARFGL
jgi:hypothetical protein